MTRMYAIRNLSHFHALNFPVGDGLLLGVRDLSGDRMVFVPSNTSSFYRGVASPRGDERSVAFCLVLLITIFYASLYYGNSTRFYRNAKNTPWVRFLILESKNAPRVGFLHFCRLLRLNQKTHPGCVF